VLTSSGEILTNNHVIDGATSISVTDIGNGKTYTATVVGYDTTKDIAVLQLRDASGLQTASIGNSSNVSVGETVVGIGNAGGTGGTPSAAGGTVTALDQSITASDESSGSSEQLTDLIETNADIQAGDSGGSLVDSSGQVIAMDTAASTGSSDSTGGQSSGYQSYAIPINEAISIANEIEAGLGSSAWKPIQTRKHTAPPYQEQQWLESSQVRLPRRLVLPPVIPSSALTACQSTRLKGSPNSSSPMPRVTK
jgi:S1-C subfamily serine protease